MKLPIIPQDKANHILYGLIIFFITALITNIWIGLITATLFGVGKEIYDFFNKDRHTSDIWDAMATIIGGIGGILIVLLLSGCSATWHYQKAIDKGYTPSTTIEQVKTKEIIPEVVTINGKDTLIYAQIEIIEKRDTVYFPKTKIDYRIDKNRMKFMEDSIRLSNIRFKDSLKLSMKKDVKNNRNVVRSKKKGLIQRFKDYLIVGILFFIVGGIFFFRARKRLPFI